MYNIHFNLTDANENIFSQLSRNVFCNPTLKHLTQHDKADTEIHIEALCSEHVPLL